MDPVVRATIEIIAAATVPITIAVVTLLCVLRRIEMGYRALFILETGAVLPMVLIFALEGWCPSGSAAAVLGGVAGYIVANVVRRPNDADQT